MQKIKLYPEKTQNNLVSVIMVSVVVMLFAMSLSVETGSLWFYLLGFIGAYYFFLAIIDLVQLKRSKGKKDGNTKK